MAHFQKGSITMKKYHNISHIQFNGFCMSFNADGKPYEIDLRKHSKRLAESSLSIKSNFEISPSGYGIHWPKIDEDLSIDGLIKQFSRRVSTTHPRKRKSLRHEFA
jgi:hypothetical protein